MTQRQQQWEQESWDVPDSNAQFQSPPNFIVGLLLTIFFPASGFSYIGMLGNTFMWLGLIGFFGIAFGILLVAGLGTQNMLVMAMGLLGLLGLSILQIVHYVLAYKQRAAVNFYPDIPMVNKVLGILAAVFIPTILFFAIPILAAVIIPNMVSR